MSTDPGLDAPAGETPEPPPEEGDLAPQKKKPSFLKELPVLILIAFGLALLIKSFLIQAFYIPSESMVPTLNIGDRVLVNKVVYKIRDPRRGEVIVFVGERLGKRSFWTRVRETLTSGLGGAQPAERDFIKRIIGLPGETVDIKGGKITITPADGGKSFELNEPYLATSRDLGNYGPHTVPKDNYFVMGDNRPNSSDSRSTLGPIQRSEIVGRAFIRVWPLSRLRRLRAPEYSATAVVLLWPVLRHRRRARRTAA